MTRFLALDPSSTVTGWAVFDDDRLVAWGKIDTKKVEYSFRFQFIVNELVKVRQEYAFQEVAAEETKFAWKGRQIAALRIAFVSIQKWTERNKLPFRKYNVSSWKNSVLGNQHATKDDTAATVRMIFPRLPAGLGEHEVDAIGVGLYHAGILKLEGMAQ
jgi:Holliday junction resolvasome RuvABC endonuclease subunit